MGFGDGKVAVQGEQAQPSQDGDGVASQVQPGTVAGVRLRGEPGGPARLQLFDPVLGVCLGTVPGIEVLDLPGGGVRGERAVAPVRVLPQLGLLPGAVSDGLCK